MNDTKTKKKMAFPHTLIIILIMIVFAAILTYLIQAGQYDRIEVAGRKVVDPASYHTVPSNRATPFDIFVAIPAGMQAVASISNMVLIIGGSFAVIEATGAKCLKWAATRAQVFFLSLSSRSPCCQHSPAMLRVCWHSCPWASSLPGLWALMPW